MSVRLAEMSINGVELPIENAERLEAIIDRVRQADAAEILRRLQGALDAATFKRVLAALK